jgi:hypothetical protein
MYFRRCFGGFCDLPENDELVAKVLAFEQLLQVLFVRLDVLVVVDVQAFQRGCLNTRIMVTQELFY